MYLKNKDWLLEVVLLILSMTCLLNSIFLDFRNDVIFTCVMVIILSVYTLYKFRFNIGLIIVAIFILISNYSIVIGVYLDSSLRPKMYDQVIDFTVYNKGITTILLFEIGLLLFLLIKSNSVHIVSKSNDFNKTIGKLTSLDKLFSILCLIVFLVIFFTQFKFGENGERATGTALMEYRTIFFIIGLLFSKGNKKIKKAYLIALILTSLIVFSGGNRADALSPIISYYVFAYDGNKKHGGLKFIFVIFIAYIMMVTIGVFRSNFQYNFDSIEIVFRKLIEEKLTFDTAIYAYFPSIGTISISNYFDKLQILVNQITYIFLGGSYGEFRLQYVLRNVYFHTYGFVSPVYFYPWLGIYSGLAFSAIVIYYVKIIFSNTKNMITRYKYGMFLYFCSMTPRWYLYDPFPLIRGILIFSIVFFLINTIYNILCGKKLFILRH